MRICILAAIAIAAAAADGTIAYEGSSTVYPIIVAAADRYAEIEPRFSLEAKPTGSSAGFRSMLAKTCTINGASRPIKAKEVKAAADAKLEFLEVPVAYDALSIVGNPRNQWLKDLKVSELQALYATGGATNWKSVRSGFPDAPVALFGAGSDSGTYDYFQEAVITKTHKFRPDITVSEDDHVLVQGVSANVNAIGYMGLAYLIENAQVLKPIAIDNGSGPVMPTKQTVLDGTYVPLSRPIFVYVRSEMLSRPDVVGFINFLLDKPEIIESVGYVALPASMRATIKARFARKTTGSIFSGMAIGTTLAQAMGIETRAETPQATAPPKAPGRPAWKGPSAAAYQQELERLRAASLDLARRSLDDGATVEELATRSAELKKRIDALAEAFRSAPRSGANGLSLAEAAGLAQ